MISQKQDIDYSPHSRPKKYFILESQLRSGVKGATFTDVYILPSYRSYPKLTVTTAIVWLIVMGFCAAGIYYLLTT